MSPWGHHAIGLSIGITGAWILDQGNYDDSLASMMNSLTFLAGALFGGRAPDKLEIARWSDWTNERYSVIPHRTLTHWPPLWVGAFLYALYYLQQSTDATDIAIGWGAVGFTLSAFIHLAMDIMTPSGIPLLNPFGRRTALKVYSSGSLVELPLVLSIVGVCFVVVQLAGAGVF